ncbi:MAG TPA: hypothetical protein VFL83_04370 [Anaeromyxobacter sp.]|nr:hypothetical protein [Anaeromyxobacter sp.]
MPRARKTTRAQVLALPRPTPAVAGEWVVAALAAALLLAALVVP